MVNQVIDLIRLDGGVLCLDFVNTVPDRFDSSERDNLNSFSDLIYWARKAGAIDDRTFKILEKTGPQKAKTFFTEALALRSLIYAIFSPLSHRQRVKPTDLAAFNKLTARYFPFLEIVSHKNGFSERWNLDADHFYTVTAPIVKSTHELLLSDKLARVKECPNCGWLFLDTTKNGRRRWCSMEDCGSNVKALEYYYRKRSKEQVVSSK